MLLLLTVHTAMRKFTKIPRTISSETKQTEPHEPKSQMSDDENIMYRPPQKADNERMMCMTQRLREMITWVIN